MHRKHVSLDDMPKSATNRGRLRTLILVAVLIGAAAAAGWLMIRGGPPVNAPLASHPPASSAATPTPARLAASTASAAAVRAVTPSELSTIRVIVSRNDTLDHIFRRLALSLSDLASLRSLPGIRAHLDRLRPGETLTLTAKSGSLVGLERRLNIDQTLKVDRSSQGFTANVLQNPLATRARTISASIDSSLFESMAAAGGHDQTALSLADIFGYDIDFVLDIRPGDTFTVTYTEVLQDGKYLQDGPVLAARFINQGKEYLAVRYVGSSGNADYYSPQGRSLHKAFLRAPLEFTRVSSPFSLHRLHPILNTMRAHKGVDYAAPIGTPVRAAGDGRVLFAGRRGGYGNLVELDHSRGITTVYGHLSRFASGLRPGQHVTQGQVIAFVGMTGLATGPHLHYEYRVDGVFKNPQTIKFPEALPIDGPQRADFLAKSAPLLASLNPPPGPSLVSR
jgi:murein DD-endopeptidase MepM/ murein hydrolase activator NlpD